MEELIFVLHDLDHISDYTEFEKERQENERVRIENENIRIEQEEQRQNDFDNRKLQDDERAKKIDGLIGELETTEKELKEQIKNGDFRGETGLTALECKEVIAERKQVSETVEISIDKFNRMPELNDVFATICGEVYYTIFQVTVAPIVSGEKMVVTAQSIGEKNIKGDKGDRGEQGEAFKYSDFTPEQLQALKGEKGDKPQKGVDYWTAEDIASMKGEKGEPGKAFEYSDFTQEQLEALKGAKGEKGEDGHTPVKGVDYWTDDEVASMKGEKGEAGYSPKRGTDYWTEADVNQMKAEMEAYANELIGNSLDTINGEVI